jgi:nanoRNase/pAp phosphatase (c-di-AMP/oligoRNAs hydrolase)
LETIFDLLNGNILLLCHHNADPDSICSAYGFQKLIEALYPSLKPDIFLPGGESHLSKQIIESFGIKIIENPLEDDYDVFIILDTASLSQLDDWEKKVQQSKAIIIVIDHHTPHPKMMDKTEYIFVDESATSTCEIVYQYYIDSNIEPSRNVARALLVGIAYDSRHFSIATPKTLKAASSLLEINGTLDNIFSLLKTERNRSEKIARLKGSQRMQIHDVKGWMIATTNVSSFQASTARALIGLGADLSVACGNYKTELRASFRSTNEFYRVTNVHLGELAQTLGNKFNGEGSGHPTAAGLNGIGETELFLQKTVHLLNKILNTTN